MRVEPPDLVRRCKDCGEEKPIDRFQFGRSRHGKHYRKHTCRVCVKRQQRRREGILPRPLDAAVKTRARREAAIRKTALRGVLGCLRLLFEVRCHEISEPMTTVRYRARYRRDTSFREKEIARRWSKRALEEGLPDDGTLDGATLCRLFAEASECPYCGELMPSRDKRLDHVIPRAQGGAHSIANVLVCCHRCNAAKRDHPLGLFLAREWGIAVTAGDSTSCVGPWS